MNKYLKAFLLRGLAFSGLGPIILAVIYFIISLNLAGISLSAKEVLIGVISTYILAFIQAGASVFNQIEHWCLAKSLLIHFSFLYFAYALCYLLNSWIPFNIAVLLVFTAVFIVVYFAVWITVYLIVKKTSSKLNASLVKKEA